MGGEGYGLDRDWFLCCFCIIDSDDGVSFPKTNSECRNAKQN